MALETLRATLGWAALINYALLLLWFCLWLGGRDAMRRWHGRWFGLSQERFDAIHYAGMAAYKIAIWLFLITPWLALRIVG